jgi:hypothetical protein
MLISRKIKFLSSASSDIRDGKQLAQEEYGELFDNF